MTCQLTIVVEGGEKGVVLAEFSMQSYTNFSMEIVHALRSPENATHVLFGFVYRVCQSTDGEQRSVGYSGCEPVCMCVTRPTLGKYSHTHLITIISKKENQKKLKLKPPKFSPALVLFRDMFISSNDYHPIHTFIKNMFYSKVGILLCRFSEV